MIDLSEIGGNNMLRIDVYKRKVEKLINEAKLCGVEIQTYEVMMEGCDKPIECGISISDGKNRVKVPTYKDNTIEVLE